MPYEVVLYYIAGAFTRATNREVGCGIVRDLGKKLMSREKSYELEINREKLIESQLIS